MAQFPTLDNQSLEIAFLIDTGADRTILSPFDGSRLREQFGLDLLSLPRGVPSSGVGGRTETRRIAAVLTTGDFATELTLPILEPPPGRIPVMPSLLGRDIIYEFALHLDAFRDRALLLDRAEADSLDLP